MLQADGRMCVRVCCVCVSLCVCVFMCMCVYVYTRAQSERDELKRERDELETKVCVTETGERSGGRGGAELTPANKRVHACVLKWCTHDRMITQRP